MKRGRSFYSEVHILNSDQKDFIIYKSGLTQSEKTVLKSKESERTFLLNGYRLGVVICRELEDNLYKYFDKNNQPDLLLWPSYWGWDYHKKWRAINKDDGKKKKCFKQVEKIKKPLIQINFSTQIEKNKGLRKCGKSIILNSKNKVVGQGAYGKEDKYIVLFDSGRIKKLK